MIVEIYGICISVNEPKQRVKWLPPHQPSPAPLHSTPNPTISNFPLVPQLISPFPKHDINSLPPTKGEYRRAQDSAATHAVRLNVQKPRAATAITNPPTSKQRPRTQQDVHLRRYPIPPRNPQISAIDTNHPLSQSNTTPPTPQQRRPTNAAAAPTSPPSSPRSPKSAPMKLARGRTPCPCPATSAPPSTPSPRRWT